MGTGVVVPLLQNETSRLSGSGDVIRMRRNFGGKYVTTKFPTPSVSASGGRRYHGDVLFWGPYPPQDPWPSEHHL
jgi:hypothetical protein